MRFSSVLLGWQIALLCLLGVHSGSVCAFQEGGPAKNDWALVVDLAEKRQWDRVETILKDPFASTRAVGQTQPDGMTGLHWAVYHGNETIAALMLDVGFNASALTKYQVSPLSIACAYGNSKVAKVLLSSDSKVGLEAKRLGGERPLMLAARNGNGTIVRMLIEAGVDVNAREVKGQNAIMWAAAAGNADVVKLLIEAGADVDYKTKQGFNALMFAARQGKIDAAMCLLDGGYDVNDVMQPARTSGRNPRKGMSPLMLAVESGHFELALKFVQRGANPNDQRSGFGPLHAISWVRRTPVGDNPAGDPAPRTTGAVNSLDFVRQMVTLGAKVDLKCAYKGKTGKAKFKFNGATPFLFAAKNADLPLMNLLLELDADPKQVNDADTNALMLAAGIGVFAVGEEPGTVEEVDKTIRRLLDLGLDINAVNKNGETAMHGAAYRTYPETVKLLSRHGADPKIWNRKNKYGWTPRMIANGSRPGSLKPFPKTIAVIDDAAEATPVKPH